MLLNEIAAAVLDIRFRTLPVQAVQTAKEAILDTIGVTIAGAHGEATAPVSRTILNTAGAGSSLIFGEERRTDTLSAALINGVAAHALDFDDCSNTMGGHPSAPVVPAIWALAEEIGSDGEAFIAAYVAGVECECKIGRAVNFHHYEKGWHPTSTLGTFGSAAACGHLIGLDPERLAHALALAASMASGLKANFGTMAKPFHVGHAARNGMLAALLARNGMQANPAALEDSQGFFAVYNGAGTFAAERILQEWGNPLDVIEPGIAFKRHPCCGSTHPAVDAMLELRSRYDLTPDSVALVESWTHPRRLKHTDRPNPQNGLDGKFSVQYVLACALAEGIVSLDHFSDDAVFDPAIRELLGRIKAAPDPQATMDTTDHFYARVRITLRSGEQVEAFVDRPVGRDRAHPLPAGTLEAKFRDCAGQVLTDGAAGHLLERLLALDTVGPIALLSNIIAEGMKPGAPDERAALRAIGM
jgi:2-methylcitrate dehydratase PrpD